MTLAGFFGEMSQEEAKSMCQMMVLVTFKVATPTFYRSPLAIP
jgi:hypothetical protein